MEHLIYVFFGTAVVSLLALCVWVMRTAAKTTALLEDATTEIEYIASEVIQIAQEVADITDDLEQAQLYEKTCPKNRRKGDRKDN